MVGAVSAPGCPYASYFNQGIAFHEYPDVPTYPGLPRLRASARARGQGRLSVCHRGYRGGRHLARRRSRQAQPVSLK